MRCWLRNVKIVMPATIFLRLSGSMYAHGVYRSWTSYYCRWVPSMAGLYCFPCCARIYLSVRMGEQEEEAFHFVRLISMSQTPPPPCSPLECFRHYSFTADPPQQTSICEPNADERSNHGTKSYHTTTAMHTKLLQQSRRRLHIGAMGKYSYLGVSHETPKIHHASCVCYLKLNVVLLHV